MVLATESCGRDTTTCDRIEFCEQGFRLLELSMDLAVFEIYKLSWCFLLGLNEVNIIDISHRQAADLTNN